MVLAWTQQLYAIWTSLLDFRALGASPLQLASLDLVGSLSHGCAQAYVSAVLCHRLHPLGWRIESEQLVRDRYGPFCLQECPLAELKLRVGWAWQDVVAGTVSKRLDFGGFCRVNVAETRRGLSHFPFVDQSALRAVLNGTTFTGGRFYHWSDNGSLLCPMCGSVDGLHHKYWHCSFAQDLLQQVPQSVQDLVPVLPSWACDRGWSISSSRLLDWRRYLLQLPSTVEFRLGLPPVSGVLDLFADGSCLFGSEPDFRVASWSLSVPRRSVR